jgi:hypothetical protein
VHSRLEAVRVARAAGLRSPERQPVTTARPTTIPIRPNGPGGR